MQSLPYTANDEATVSVLLIGAVLLTGTMAFGPGGFLAALPLSFVIRPLSRRLLSTTVAG